MVFSMSLSVSAEDISVTVKNKEVKFPDVVPTLENGTVLIPLRAVFEAIGAEVYWVGETSTIMCANDDLKLILQIGNNQLFKNNDKIEIAAPVIINNRTMITPDVIEKAFDITAEITETAIAFK